MNPSSFSEAEWWSRNNDTEAERSACSLTGEAQTMVQALCGSSKSFHEMACKDSMFSAREAVPRQSSAIQDVIKDSQTVFQLKELVFIRAIFYTEEVSHMKPPWVDSSGWKDIWGFYQEVDDKNESIAI